MAELHFAEWARANLNPMQQPFLDKVETRLGHIPDIDRSRRAAGPATTMW